MNKCLARLQESLDEDIYREIEPGTSLSRVYPKLSILEEYYSDNEFPVGISLSRVGKDFLEKDEELFDLLEGYTIPELLKKVLDGTVGCFGVEDDDPFTENMFILANQLSESLNEDNRGLDNAYRKLIDGKLMNLNTAKYYSSGIDGLIELSNDLNKAIDICVSNRKRKQRSLHRHSPKQKKTSTI